jgi:hypothetical protein
MKSTSYYPVLLTGDVAGTAAFYQAHFRFLSLFDSGWYVHLQSAEDKRVNLGIIDGNHETIPPAGRGRVGGLILNSRCRIPTPYMSVRRRPGCPSSRACVTRISGSGISSPPTPTA